MTICIESLRNRVNNDLYWKIYDDYDNKDG